MRSFRIYYVRVYILCIDHKLRVVLYHDRLIYVIWGSNEVFVKGRKGARREKGETGTCIFIERTSLPSAPHKTRKHHTAARVSEVAYWYIPRHQSTAS